MRQNKKDYFETLDMKSVTDNKMFWKTVAPLFSNKSKASNKITLSENEKLITNDQKSAEVFNNYFNSIVEELNIPIDQNLLNDASLFDDPIIAAIHKHKRHPSILKIKEQLKKDDLFSFYHVDPDKMLKIIENIDSEKVTQHGDIPVRIIKENKFIFSKVLSEIFNFYIDNNTFPNGLKKADITLFTRKMILLIKLIIDPLVYYLFYLNVLNAVYMIRFMNILILYYRKFNVASEKVSVRNIH